MLQFSDYFNKYKKSNNKNNLLVIFGTGLIGRLTLKALKEKNIKVDYFCDSDKRKQTEIENVKVISPNDLDKLDKNIDIFQCTQYYSSVVPFLENKGFNNLYKSSDLLDAIDIKKIYFVIKKMKAYQDNENLSLEKFNRHIGFYKKMGMKDNYIKKRIFFSITKYKKIKKTK